MAKIPEGFYWCFTINNYTEEEYQDLLNGDYNYIIIGKEIGKEGTPHLQGYLQLPKKKKISGMKKINNRAHWEISRGSPEDNKKYCSEEGNFEERGTMGKPGKKKMDMTKAVFQIIDGATTRDLLKEHGDTFIKNKKKIEEVARQIKREDERKKRKTAADNVELREWQKKAVEKLLNQDNRKILWVIDQLGNNGKTFLAHYLSDKYEAKIFQNGRSADIKFIWNLEEFVIFDLVRSCQDHINYEVIEDLKNGRFNSTKYGSCEKAIDHGRHVKMIVFTNEEPDREKLSPDRWDIMKLSALKLAGDTEEPPKKKQRKNPFAENNREDDQQAIEC